MKRILLKKFLPYIISLAVLVSLIILMCIISAFTELTGLQREQTISENNSQLGSSTVSVAGNVEGESFSNNLVQSIESWEGFSPVGYTGEDSWNITIGYGHVEEPGEVFTTLTQPEAEDLLISDLKKYSASVSQEFAGYPLTQNQFDALTDLAYGFGTNIWPSISLTQDVKAGASPDILKQDFECLDHVGGEESPGLLRRLDAEQIMYTQGIYVLNS